MNLTRVMRMYGSLVGIGLACSIAIVTTFEVTKPIIQANRDQMRQEAVLKVIPGAESSVGYALTEEKRFVRLDSSDDQTPDVYAGYDHEGRLVGLALEAEGFGYQDTIRLMYGYSFSDQTITAIEVLESRETPGLGDRIETDANFQANFGSLSVRLKEDATSLQHQIEFVKAGEKKEAWQIDGITGATISSRAVAEMLQESTAWWIPLANRRHADFERSDQGVNRE